MGKKHTNDKLKSDVQKFLKKLLWKAWGIAFQKLIENIVDMFFN